MQHIETREIATDVVSALKQDLPAETDESMKDIRSLFVSGSYVRGDWLERNSDIDISVVFHSGIGNVIETDFGVRYISNQNDFEGYKRIWQIITSAIGDREFYSQVPGGVDIMAYPEGPESVEFIRELKGPRQFNVFLFDLLDNSQILWGENIIAKIPSPPDYGDLVLNAFQVSAERIARLEEGAADKQRAAFLAYRAIQMAQIVFGEKTLDKRRLLYLYEKKLPEFSTKGVGSRIIRQYIGAFYPDHSPSFLDVPIYQRFYREVMGVAEKEIHAQKTCDE